MCSMLRQYTRCEALLAVYMSAATIYVCFFDGAQVCCTHAGQNFAYIDVDLSQDSVATASG